MNAELAPTFTTAEASESVGIQIGLTDSWLSRHHFTLGANDVTGQGKGKARKWSRRTVRKLAVAFALWSLGIGAAKAGVAADMAMQKIEALPGHNHLYVSMAPTGQVKAIERETLFEDLYEQIAIVEPALALIDVTNIIRRVDDKLDTISKNRI